MTLYGDNRVESARLPGWDYRTAGWYFVTICVRNHACLLGNIANGRMQLSPAGQVADCDLRSLAAHYRDVSVDGFVVMPNHVHAIFEIGGAHMYSPSPRPHVQIVRNHPLAKIAPRAGSLSVIVRSYKAGVTRHCHELGLAHFAWQSGFYEHIVRTDVSLNAIRDYIEKNPINWPDDPEIIRGS